MTIKMKELIKKYKKEFDHWLNGGEVLFFYWEDWYSSTYNPEMVFNHISPDDVKYYVINDEFVEFRKALAEGKSIQMLCRYDKMEPIWDDMTEVIKSIGFVDVKENYRIKPEEPKFKVGDWVVEIHSTTKAQVLELFGNQIRVKFCYPDAIITTDSSDFIPWVPKKGEYCWFWNKGATLTVLKLLEIVEDGNRKYFAAMPNIPHFLGGYYQYCEPFFGTLPTELRN